MVRLTSCCTLRACSVHSDGFRSRDASFELIAESGCSTDFRNGSIESPSAHRFRPVISCRDAPHHLEIASTPRAFDEAPRRVSSHCRLRGTACTVRTIRARRNGSDCTRALRNRSCRRRRRTRPSRASNRPSPCLVIVRQVEMLFEDARRRTAARLHRHERASRAQAARDLDQFARPSCRAATS